MSTKLRQSLAKCFMKLADDSFDEETIRALLIIAREQIKHNGLIRELAHFIAHPDRDQGMFHKKVNSRYAKLKLVEDQVQDSKNAGKIKEITTEKELSDMMLGGISLYKVESKIFKIIYEDGLEEIDEDYLKKYTGLSRKEVAEMLKRFYIAKDGFHYLTTLKSRAIYRFAIENRSKIGEDPEIDESIAQQRQLIESIEKRMDNIVKVVRGTIGFKPVFSSETFTEEILELLTMLCEKFQLDLQFIGHAKRNMNEILLCVMSLLHDSNFVYYDKAMARTYLGFYLPERSNKPEGEIADMAHHLFDHGVFALFTASPNIKFPLYVSELKIRDYISANLFSGLKELTEFAESPWITAERLGQKLMLVPNPY